MLLTVLLSTLLVGSTLAQQQTCVIDVAVVVDESGSIRDQNPPGVDNWQLVINFLVNIITGFDIGLGQTRVGLVTFGNRAILHFDLDDYDNKGEMINQVLALPYKGGNTNTTGGLRETRQSLFAIDGSGGNRPDATDVILLITDGKPTREVDDLIPEVEELKRQNVRIVGIGITNAVNATLMRQIVSDPSDYFTADDFDDLSSLLDRIIQETCRTVAPPEPVTTTPQPTGPCAERADLYMVMDGSGSINEQNFNLMKAFANTLIADLTIDNDRVRMGFLLFSDDAQPQFNLNQFNNRNVITTFLDDLRYPRGRTNTADAIRYVRSQGFTSGNGDRSDVPNIMVIFTDGNSNDPEDTMSEAYLAKQAGIHIITVGIGGWTNQMELRMVASYPYENNYIEVRTFNDLDNDLKITLRELICDNVNECNSGPCENGGTCVNGINMFICRCRSGFAGSVCERPCRSPADVAFAIDSSGSIGRANFLRELDFVRSVVMGLNINEDSRVGAEQYSNNAQVQFHLDDYSTKMGILNALSMSYLAGTTNTAAAISTMRNSMFTSGNGDRGNIPNIGVVITDGRSNDFMATWNEARQARSNDIQMVAVGIGNNLRMDELQAIASYPNDLNVLIADRFEDLPGIQDSLLDAVCNNENACASPNPCNNEGRCIDLLHSYRCECLNGFSGKNCERNCDTEYDIIFAIDSSGSIRNERYPRVLEFISSIVEEFEVSSNAARFGAVIFSDTQQLQFNLNRYQSKQDVISAIKNAPYIGGRTNIASALREINERMFQSGVGDRNNVQNYVIMLTDGASNEEVDNTVPEAIETRVNGAKIITIGVGTDVNVLELRGMTSQPHSNMMMMAESFNEIDSNNAVRDQIIRNIIDSTCDDVNECQTQNPCRNGAQCTDDLHSYICTCTNDFSGQNCDRRCTKQMDVTFVLDFSGSLDQVIDVVIAFAHEVTQGLPFRLSRSQVAVISFSDLATLHFDLNDNPTKREVLNGLSFSRYGGRTNTQAALQMTYNDVFRSDRGDRNGVDNIVIVVTDGGSNIQRDDTIRRAQDAKNRNIEIYVAAVYDAPDMGEVNGIASDPDNEHVVLVPNAQAVQAAANQLLDRLCS